MKLANPDTLASGGYRIVLGDGTNTRAYYVGGGDVTMFTRRGWVRALLDTDNLPSNYDQLAGSSAPTLSAITLIGVGGIQPTKVTGNSPNFFWDSLDYCSNSTHALQITGGSSSVPGTFADIVSADDTGGYGIVRQIQAGIYGIQGRLLFGATSGATSTYFKETDSILIFEKPPVTVSDGYYQIVVTGTSTGTTSVVFGNKVGSGDDAVGANGCTFMSAGPAAKFYCASADVDELDIYGCKFYKLNNGVTVGPDSSHEFIGNTIDQCGQADVGSAVVRNCTFSGYTADADAALLWSNNINIKNCAFNSNTDATNDPHAIEHPDSGNFTYDGLTFSGNDYDINFSAASGTLTINATNGANPSTYEITGGGTSVTINNAVSVNVHVEDTDGNAIQYAKVYIQKDPPPSYTAGSGNNAGDSTLVITQTIPSDIPQSGWCIVFDVSENAVLPYRYASHDGTNTFTLPSEVTYACTGGGTSTLLEDTAHDFLSLNIEEGDTIRNVTDGSWAVVDEVVDSDTIYTSPLQGGSDNTWTSGDTYSVHRLATTLVSGTDTVDVPLLVDQTDGSGDVSLSYNYTSDQDIKIRVRSNEGATKYIPIETSGTVHSTGFSVTIVMQEDTEAT